MATANKKSKLALPPVAPVKDEKAMKAMIEKGGAVASSKTATTTSEEDTLKTFTFKIYESELAKIREIQARAPKRDRKSIHDFVVDAVLERIKKQY